LTEEQLQGISPFYRAAVMGEDITQTVKKYQTPDDEEVYATYQEIVLEEPKEEMDESKVEYENAYFEVAEGNAGEDDGASLIEEAEYESILDDTEEQQHIELDDDTELIVGDVNDQYVYDSDDEVAVLDNVLDDEYEHENIVVKKCKDATRKLVESDSFSLVVKRLRMPSRRLLHCSVLSSGSALSRSRRFVLRSYGCGYGIA